MLELEVFFVSLNYKRIKTNCSKKKINGLETTLIEASAEKKLKTLYKAN